jgi:hypothetical protein
MTGLLDFTFLDLDTKRKKITSREKLNVVHEVKVKSVTSWVEIANRLGLAPSSLSRILLNNNKIIEGKLSVEHIKRRV